MNFAFVYILIGLMQLHAPPPALETLAYTGYSFVGYCVSIVVGWVLGRSLGWYTAWLYTSACMAVFLIRSLKQVIRVDANQRGALHSSASEHAQAGAVRCDLMHLSAHFVLMRAGVQGKARSTSCWRSVLLSSSWRG